MQNCKECKQDKLFYLVHAKQKGESNKPTTLLISSLSCYVHSTALIKAQNIQALGLLQATDSLLEAHLDMSQFDGSVGVIEL